VPVSINISGANLEEEDFVQRLKQGLERQLTAIQLEFTESALIRMGRRVFERLKAIKALGVTCAIDDFGTAIRVSPTSRISRPTSSRSTGRSSRRSTVSSATRSWTGP
jgi:EAL domain-containing protein (putative c-di-GMP-specific phosphodiesterase class I)